MHAMLGLQQNMITFLASEHLKPAVAASVFGLTLKCRMRRRPCPITKKQWSSRKVLVILCLNILNARLARNSQFAPVKLGKCTVPQRCPLIYQCAPGAIMAGVESRRTHHGRATARGCPTDIHR